MSWPRPKRFPAGDPRPELEHLDRLGPAVLRVIAAAIEYKSKFGEQPPAGVVAELAAAEGASPGACLAMVRWELPDRNGEPSPLNADGDFNGPVVVADSATCWALAIRSEWPPGIRVRMVTPEGRRISKRALRHCAETW